VLDGSPLLLAPNSLISAAEVIQDVLMHLRCHHRAIAVDDLTNVREQDPQGTVLAVHISEDVDPKMRRNRQICRPEQCSVGLGRLLLKVSDRSPATLPGSWSLIECFDAISDFQTPTSVVRRKGVGSQGRSPPIGPLPASSRGRPGPYVLRR
jgi:hypothetical protein